MRRDAHSDEDFEEGVRSAVKDWLGGRIRVIEWRVFGIPVRWQVEREGVVLWNAEQGRWLMKLGASTRTMA